MGVPTGLGMVLVTRPYYRSTYTFVTRANGARIASFDDVLFGPTLLHRGIVTWVIRRGRRLIRLDVPTGAR